MSSIPHTSIVDLRHDCTIVHLSLGSLREVITYYIFSTCKILPLENLYFDIIPAFSKNSAS